MKLNLNEFIVKSFVTSIESNELRKINGGAANRKCDKLSTCPATCEEKLPERDTGNACMSDAGGGCQHAERNKAVNS